MGERTEGERWARRELERLAAAGWSPEALGSFLARSKRRASDVRAARPQLAAQARRWSATGFAAVGVLIPRGRRRAAAAWWGACALMLDWHLGMVESEDGVPRPLGPADAVTLARAWAVPVVWEDAPPAVVLAAWASDGLDGALARRTAPTRAGRDLEGLVDLCFAASALRGAHRRGGLSAFAAGGEALRLAAGLGHALWRSFGQASQADPRITRAARASTPLRVGGLVLAGAAGRARAGSRRRRVLRAAADVAVLAGSAVGAAALLGTRRDAPEAPPAG